MKLLATIEYNMYKSWLNKIYVVYKFSSVICCYL
jgi:hypothetical protein